jgi:predicted XRE-type DNA-binding protein
VPASGRRRKNIDLLQHRPAHPNDLLRFANRTETTVPIRITRSTGNVFEDVGFPPEEAAHLLIRSDLMIQVCETIEQRGLSVREAAATLRVTQRRVRELVRGRIELFSIDTLIGMLCRLDVSVSVKVARRPRRIVRTSAGSRAAFLRVLAKVRDGPPMFGDEPDIARAPANAPDASDND